MHQRRETNFTIHNQKTNAYTSLSLKLRVFENRSPTTQNAPPVQNTHNTLDAALIESTLNIVPHVYLIIFGTNLHQNEWTDASMCCFAARGGGEVAQVQSCQVRRGVLEVVYERDVKWWRYTNNNLQHFITHNISDILLR